MGALMRKLKLDPTRVTLMIVAALTVGCYTLIEARGIAFGGRKAPARITPEELRSSSSGSSTFLYWSHGLRGK